MSTFQRTNLDRTAQAVAYYNYMLLPNKSLYMCFYEGDPSIAVGSNPQELPSGSESLTVSDIQNPAFYIKISTGVTSAGYIKLIKEDIENGDISYFGSKYSIVNEADAFSSFVNLVYIRVKIIPNSITYNGEIGGYALVLNPSLVSDGAIATGVSYVNSEIDSTSGSLLFINNVKKYTRISTSGEFVEIILPF